MNEPPSIQSTQIIPIGGVGEFGANATIFQTPNTCILVDFGLMFPPNRGRPGVEFYINDIQLLLKQFPNLSAIVVTHAHEDHIGGIGFLLEARDLPVYTGKYTAEILKKSLEYHDVRAEIHKVELGEELLLGDFTVQFIGVTHSIVGACAVAVTSADGTVIHSGDFKVDPLPGDDYPFQSEVFQALGERGVDLLIVDSTNATKPGFCPSDYEILPTLQRLIETAPGRVFLTTFSSHMPRIRRLLEIARKTRRKIAFVGRSFRKHFKACLDVAYLGTEAASVVVDEDQAGGLGDKEVIYVVAGSQAESRSALASIAKGSFRGLSFRSGDKVIFSSKNIPGNERQIMIFMSELERRGVDVVTSYNENVHTSGHGYREDIAFLLRLTQPGHVAPIHGEFHQLLSNHGWLQEIIDDHQQVLFLEDGNIVTLKDRKIRVNGQVQTAMIPIDGNQNLPLNKAVLKERRDMMYSGLVLINAYLKGDDYHYEVDTHGVCEVKQYDSARRLEESLYDLALSTRDEQQSASQAIFRHARSLMKRMLRGKPIIKLVVEGRIYK